MDIQKELKDVQKKLEDIEKKQEMLKRIQDLERLREEKQAKRPTGHSPNNLSLIHISEPTRPY